MDDSNDNPAITTDDSGMSVVTIEGNQGLPWWAWVLIAGGLYYMFQAKS